MDIKKKIVTKPEWSPNQGAGRSYNYWNFVVLGTVAVLIAGYSVWIYRPSNMNNALTGSESEKKIIVPNVSKADTKSGRLLILVRSAVTAGSILRKIARETII